MLCRGPLSRVDDQASGSHAASRLTQDAPSKSCSRPLRGKDRLVNHLSAAASPSSASPAPSSAPSAPSRPAPQPHAARTTPLLEGPCLRPSERLPPPNAPTYS